MLRKSFISVLCLLFATSVMADRIDIDKARNIAASFNVGTGVARSNGFASNKDLTLAAQSTGYYIFNYGGDGGYVIVATSDLASDEVIGYAETGSFDMANISPAFKAWLDNADAQIAYAEAHPAEVKSAVYSASAKSNPYRPTSFDINRDEVKPLVSSRWAQASPYNLLCPKVNGTSTLSGCVANAMSQVMYSYKYPEHGTGTVSNSGTTITLSNNYYKWDAMTDTYDSNSSEESKNAVALIMRDAGFSINAQYSATFTGAYSSDAAKALVNNFGYDKGICHIKRDWYSKAEWQEIMYNELKNGRPMMVAGYNYYEGHCFICDAYRNGLFRYNFGWGYECVYLMTDVLEQNYMASTDVTNSGYNRSQELVIGIQPPRENQSYAEVVYNSSMFRATSKSVKRDAATATFNGQFAKAGIASSQEFTFGVMVEDEDGNPTFLSAPSSTTLSNREVTSLSVSLADFPEADGTYLVYPAYKGESGEWQLVHTTNGTQSHVIATAADGTISFSNPTEPDYDFNVSKISSTNVMPDAGTSVTVSVVYNCSRGSYYGDSYLIFVKDGTTVSRSANNPISLQQGDSRMAKYTVDVPTTNGLYEVYVVDKKNVRRNAEPLYIYVGGKSLKATIKLAEAFSVEDASLVDKEDIRFHAKVTCTKNVYLGSFKIQVYDSKFKKLGVIESEQYAILAGDTIDVDIQGALSNAVDGATYTAYITNKDGAYFSGQEDMDFVNFIVDPTGIEELLATESATLQPISVYTTSGLQVLTNAQFSQLNALPRGIYIVKTATKTYKISK